MSVFSRSREKHLRVRPMTPDDVEAVREVGQIAWSDLAMHDIGRKFRYPKRSEKIIDAYMWMEPQGCLVAEDDGKIIGSAFCHVWGRVGWIGPLEVLPTHQDAGVGKTLLRDCERYLEGRGCKVLGLETMSHIPKHIHFYMSSGYTPGALTLIVEKILRHEQEAAEDIIDVSVPDLGAALPEVSRLSSTISPLLDYSLECETIVRRRLGNALMVREGDRVVGLALLHTYQRGEEANYSSIKALLVDPAADDPLVHFDALLRKCEAISLDQGKGRLLTRFSGECPPLYNAMLERAYTLKGANVRMVKNGPYCERGVYHITSWAG